MTKTNTLLIIEDNTVNLRIMSTLLSSQGYHVVGCTGGVAGIDAALDLAPDLILLDIVMPEIDGFETCRRLKFHDATREIPVIFVTALSATEDIVRAYEAGGVDYIVKPVRRPEVIARVQTHLKLRDAVRERDKLIVELTDTLKRIKQLRGLIPICSHCKKIRDDKGYWNQLEAYIRDHSEAEFSHGICPECARILYPELYKKNGLS